MYRVCKICFSTQNGQGCADLTTNALGYCQQRAAMAPPVRAEPPRITMGAEPPNPRAEPGGGAWFTPASAPEPQPAVVPAVAVADSPPIQRLVVSFWTDTDDKDSDESVSVRIFQDQDILGSGGPWGQGEKWGNQENRNNGQPHEFAVSLARPVLLRDVDSLRLEIIKSQHGRHGGNGWHFRGTVIAETAGRRTEVWRSPTTIKLGNGRSASFSTSL